MYKGHVRSHKNKKKKSFTYAVWLIDFFNSWNFLNFFKRTCWIFMPSAIWLQRYDQNVPNRNNGLRPRSFWTKIVSGYLESNPSVCLAWAHDKGLDVLKTISKWLIWNILKNSWNSKKKNIYIIYFFRNVLKVFKKKL